MNIIKNFVSIELCILEYLNLFLSVMLVNTEKTIGKLPVSELISSLLRSPFCRKLLDVVDINIWISFLSSIKNIVQNLRELSGKLDKEIRIKGNTSVMNLE